MIGLTSSSQALEGDIGEYKKENGAVTCAVNAFGPSNFMTQFNLSIEKNLEKRRSKISDI